MALIIKFIPNYFFDPVDYPEVVRSKEISDDNYLFDQKTGGLAEITFPGYKRAYESISGANVSIFKQQAELFKSVLMQAPPSREQRANVDYMLAAGELFTLIVYAQLILENSRIYAVDSDLLEQIFSFLVKDFSAYALKMVLNYENSEEQDEFFKSMLKKPVFDEKCRSRLWEQQVFAFKDQYRMSE